MNLAEYTFEPDRHRGKKIILVRFKFNTELKFALRERFPSAKWSATKKSWYLPDLPSVRRELKMPIHSAVPEKVAELHPINQKAYINMYR